jgi:RNA polymerase sigma factor (sigma-70 family)
MPTDAFDLSGKRALIAGPGGVIEDAIAAALQAAGATTYRASAVSDELVDEAAVHLGGLDTLVTGGDLKLAVPLVELDDADLDRDVAAALNALAPAFRAAVVLCDIEGLTYEEISEVLDLKIGTVRSRIHRGRAQLRAALAHRRPTLEHTRYLGVDAEAGHRGDEDVDGAVAGRVPAVAL